MGLSDFNPLEYFRELTVFPRTVFLVGFVVFLVGIAHGSVYNKTAFSGLTVIAAGLSCHYFATCRWQEPHEPYQMHFDWWVVFKAFLMLIAAAGFAFWTYRIPAPQENASTSESQPKEVKTAPPEQHAPTIPIVQARTTKKNIQKQQQRNSGVVNTQQQNSGNNNSNVSAPNGVAIGGSNFGNPTVNNFTTPARTLDDKQIAYLANIASRIPNSQTVDILTANTKESDDYGTAIQQAFGKTATAPQLKSGPVTALVPFSKPAPIGTVICVQNLSSPTMPLAKDIGNVLVRNAVVRVMISPCSGVVNNEVRIIIAEP